MRRIIHVDADAFFAAVEQRDDRRLRGKPIAVGFDTPRGVVATASYEARRYGVGSAMPSRMARERCPELIFVPPRFTVYREVGEQIRTIFRRYSEKVEATSIDEAYLDVSEPLKGPPSGTLLAQMLKAEIVRETGLTVSAGVSYCKFLAKLASGWHKPDGLTVITPDMAEALVAELAIERIHGVGPRTALKMHQLGIRSGADLRRLSEEKLVEYFGKVGRHYYRLARGVDDRPVDPSTVRRSVSSETTFDRDLHDLEELSRHLPQLSKGVARRLERAGVLARGVSVKVKYQDHSVVTRQALLPLPLRGAAGICRAAHSILHEKIPLPRPVRLLGVGAYDLAERELAQLPLFPELLAD